MACSATLGTHAQCRVRSALDIRRARIQLVRPAQGVCTYKRARCGVAASRGTVLALIICCSVDLLILAVFTERVTATTQSQLSPLHRTSQYLGLDDSSAKICNCQVNKVRQAQVSTPSN